MCLFTEAGVMPAASMEVTNPTVPNDSNSDSAPNDTSSNNDVDVWKGPDTLMTSPARDTRNEES